MAKAPILEQRATEGASPDDVLVRELLREETRKQRRSLLAASALGIAVALTGLFPTRITALGVEFDAAEIALFPTLIAIVVGYFLVAFFLYAWNDFVHWRGDYKAARHGGESERNRSSQRLLGATFRALFDFVLPIGVAVYALYALLTL